MWRRRSAKSPCAIEENPGRTEFGSPSTPGHDLAISIGHLHATRRGHIGSRTGRGTDRNRATRRSAGNSGIAHGRQRASEPRLRGRDKSTFDIGPAIPGQRSSEGNGGGGKGYRLAHRESHFLAPVAVPGGISSNSIMTSESRLTLVAPSGGLNAKASASAIASVFHSLIRSVYCGAPARVLLVITYLRGIGCAPVWIQICQSVSCPRKARCSHSTPSTTPWPT